MKLLPAIKATAVMLFYGAVLTAPWLFDKAQAAWPYTKDVLLGALVLCVVMLLGFFWHVLYQSFK